MQDDGYTIRTDELKSLIGTESLGSPVFFGGVCQRTRLHDTQRTKLNRPILKHKHKDVDGRPAGKATLSRSIICRNTQGRSSTSSTTSIDCSLRSCKNVELRGELVLYKEIPEIIITDGRTARR